MLLPSQQSDTSISIHVLNELIKASHLIPPVLSQLWQPQRKGGGIKKKDKELPKKKKKRNHSKISHCTPRPRRKMPPPSQLAIATGSVSRLLKEQASYHNELADQEAQIAKQEESIKAGGGDEDGNAAFMLKQSVCFLFLFLFSPFLLVQFPLVVPGWGGSKSNLSCVCVCVCRKRLLSRRGLFLAR